MPSVIIDGAARSVPGGTVLDGLRAAGVHVPHLCHDDRLAPTGSCRLCLVNIDGAAHPVPACATPLHEGMAIETRTPALVDARKTLLGWMAAQHPPLAADAPETSFGRELVAHGLAEACRGAPDPALVDDSHPYIHVDMSRCIDCYRCVRICTEVQGQDTWGIWNRGGGTRVVADGGLPLGQSSCVSCGACVDTCPSGALVDKTARTAGPPERWTRTTCPYCGVGCELDVGARGDRVVTIRPTPGAPVNRGHLCSKGRYAHAFLVAPDRVTSPMLREGDGWRRVSWDDAIGFVARRLRELRAAHGPDAIGVLGSARATNEENYVAQKFARVVLGTNNIDSCARVCHAPSAAALAGMLGTGAATSSFDDIEAARTILVVGSNTTECHPVVGARIRQAARRGATLIVIDPRRTELAAEAALHLAPTIGANVALFNALAHTILAEGLVDRAFVAERASEFDKFAAFVADFAPERVAKEVGVPAADLRRAARLYAAGKPAICFHGLGITEHAQGTEAVMALINLAVLTGNLGAPGTGENPLRGQNNVQGAAHMGCEPHHLAGYATLDDGRERFERAWSAALPATRGLDLMRMLDAAQAGRLKALWAIGYDVLLTNPIAATTLAALRALELVVVQDLFLTETARAAGHVFLPAAASFEKDGTFMNSERRVQRVRRAVPAPDGARADWEILCAVARAMGHEDGFAFDSAEAIWDEIRSVWPAGAGLGYARLETAGLQWPCPDDGHPGTRRLHARDFSGAPRVALRRLRPRPWQDDVDDDFPLRLTTGRTLHQFNAGTMTGRTLHNVLRPRDVLDVAPADAARWRLTDGQRVRLRSRHGATEICVQLDERVKPGEVFASFQSPDVFLNRITGPVRDRVTGTPQYKLTAVRIEPVSGANKEE